MQSPNEDAKDRLKRLELENLRLKAELEAHKIGQKSGALMSRFLTKTTTRLVAGKRLKSSIKQLVDELPGNPSKNTISEVLSNLILRLTRIGMFAVLVAGAPLLIMAVQTYILNLQNNKLDKQNQLLGRQNERLDQQINLEEGSRRSSLVFFMSNIMDRIDDELKDNRSRKLSDGLIGRIVSLSQALRPYRYLENDELTDRQLSPERGQLLFSLINSNLNESTYDKIFARANFNFADLREANFSGAYMKGAKLAFSFFYKANFDHAFLNDADLSYAYLEEATFRNTAMDGVDLSHANLRKSYMEGISAKNGNLEMADLREIYLEGDFRSCNLEGIIIQEATMANVDLRGCTFRSLDWLDSLRTYNLKGFASLVEYYEPVQEIINKRFYTDTLYKLELDENSPAMRIINCDLAVKELVESCPRIANAKKAGLLRGQILKIYPIASPIGMPELGILKDSAYVFKLSAFKEQPDSSEIWVRFDPVKQKLWESSVRDDSTLTELLFDKKLLENFSAKCQSTF